MKLHFSFIALGLAMCAHVAQAHVGFDNEHAAQGEYKRFALKVPHGCGAAATTSIRIQLPEGIQGAKPMPKAGWTLSTETTALKTPYSSHGKTVNEDVSALVWSNGNLPTAFYDEFVFQAKVASAPGHVLFNVDQSCGAETMHWNGTSEDDAHPAAALHVDAPAAGTMHHH